MFTIFLLMSVCVYYFLMWIYEEEEINKSTERIRASQTTGEERKREKEMMYQRNH